MAKFTDRDEIEVALRYINRVRAMQPSAAAVQDLDRQEADLKKQLRDLNEREASRHQSGVSLASTTQMAQQPRRPGFRI